MSDTKEPNYSADDYALDHDLFFNERPPMPDRDAAFREALEEYRLTTRRSLDCPCEAHVALESEKLARVLALYAEREGEEYEVAFIQPDCGDPTVPEYAEEWGVGLHGTMPGWLHPGDRVRVTKVEEGQ